MSLARLFALNFELIPKPALAYASGYGRLRFWDRFFFAGTHQCPVFARTGQLVPGAADGVLADSLVGQRPFQSNRQNFIA